jgi:hypothetical protein
LALGRETPCSLSISTICRKPEALSGNVPPTRDGKIDDPVHYPSGKRFLLRLREKGSKRERASRAPQARRAPGRIPQSDRTRRGAKLSFVPAALGKTGELSRQPLVRTECCGHAQTTTQASRIAGPLFASLIPGDRHHEFFGEDSIIAPRQNTGGRLPSLEKPSCQGTFSPQ